MDLHRVGVYELLKGDYSVNYQKTPDRRDSIFIA